MTGLFLNINLLFAEKKDEESVSDLVQKVPRAPSGKVSKLKRPHQLVLRLLPVTVFVKQQLHHSLPGLDLGGAVPTQLSHVGLGLCSTSHGSHCHPGTSCPATAKFSLGFLVSAKYWQSSSVTSILLKLSSTSPCNQFPSSLF
jgi:hypothetical protein